MDITIDLSKYKYSNTVFEVCQEVNKGEPNIVLDAFYYDDWMMIGFNKLPFIIHNGKMQWGTDIHQVLLGDFCNTFQTNNISFHTCSYTSFDEEQRIKRSRYEFEIAWKEFRKASRVKVSLLDLFRFRRVVYKIPISPMSFVQAVYQVQYGSVYEYCTLFSCKENEMISILKCLGFSIANGNNDVRIDYEHVEAMRRICAHAEELTRYTNSGRRNYLLVKLSSFFYCFECYFRDCKDSIRLQLGGNAVPNELVRGEKERHWESAVTLIIVGFVTIITLYSIYYVANYLIDLKSQEDLDVWNSAYSSFLGSAFGAGISGLAAIVTSYLVINRNYKVDYHNERLSVLPVFYITCEQFDTQIHGSSQVNQFQSDKEKIYMGYYMTEPMMVKIINKGRGTAFQVILKRFADDWDSISTGMLVPNDAASIVIEKGSYSSLCLEYYDLYHNKYTQMFQISHDRNEFQVNAYQPDLIERTTRARYQQ